MFEYKSSCNLLFFISIQFVLFRTTINFVRNEIGGKRKTFVSINDEQNDTTHYSIRFGAFLCSFNHSRNVSMLSHRLHALFNVNWKVFFVRSDSPVPYRKLYTVYYNFFLLLRKTREPNYAHTEKNELNSAKLLLLLLLRIKLMSKDAVRRTGINVVCEKARESGAIHGHTEPKLKFYVELTTGEYVASWWVAWHMPRMRERENVTPKAENYCLLILNVRSRSLPRFVRLWVRNAFDR